MNRCYRTPESLPDHCVKCGNIIRGTLACLVLAGLHATLHAASPPALTLFEKADFVLSDQRPPPGDDAAWRPISLPDQWRQRMPDGIRARGWYRIRFELAQNPSSLHTVGITHPRAFRTDFFVNGRIVGGAGDLIAGRGKGPRTDLSPAFGTPLYITVPPSALRKGGNVIDIRVNATSSGTFMHGLPKVAFGDARAVRKAFQISNETGFAAQRTFFVMALTCGFITFFLWLPRRDDKVIFWYSVACLMWGLASVPRLALRWVDTFEPTIPVLSWFLNYGLVVPVVIICLRTTSLKWPRFEAGLWAFVAIEVTFPLWSSVGRWGLAWDVANTALLLAGVVIVVLHAKRPLRWSVQLQVAALLLMAALMFFEVTRYLGWFYIDYKAVRHYHVPLMLLAIGAVIFERHVLAVRRTAQANVELEQRVLERTREIESDHARMEEVNREHALAEQRRRILADLHDGLGASLIGLLHRLRDSQRQHTGIQDRVYEALLEIRIAVDALQPREDDLATILGNLRQRFDEMIRPTGLHLFWDLQELPAITGLRPTTVFELQRILLEAVTNVLKHSGARHLIITAHTDAQREIRIKIEDDGRGFDPLHRAAGLGLLNMQNRAARIGAKLEVRRREAGGTIVEVALPIIMNASSAADEDVAPPSSAVQAAGIPS